MYGKNWGRERKKRKCVWKQQERGRESVWKEWEIKSKREYEKNKRARDKKDKEDRERCRETVKLRESLREEMEEDGR